MDTPPERDVKPDALRRFIGDWKAEGLSFGGTDQADDPKAKGEPWQSVHTAKWHTGSFFMVQDERATIAGKVFDTLSVMGVDSEAGEYFVRSFENHGFYRHYKLTREDNVWTLSGPTERARIEFIDKDRTQVINWEWKPAEQWLPLCDRTATRVD